jgi:hypothetical protein
MPDAVEAHLARNEGRNTLAGEETAECDRKARDNPGRFQIYRQLNKLGIGVGCIQVANRQVDYFSRFAEEALLLVINLHSAVKK